MCRENGETRNGYRVDEGNTVESSHLKDRGRDGWKILKYVNLSNPDSQPFPFIPCSCFAWLCNAFPHCHPSPPVCPFGAITTSETSLFPEALCWLLQATDIQCDCNRNKRVGSTMICHQHHLGALSVTSIQLIPSPSFPLLRIGVSLDWNIESVIRLHIEVCLLTIKV